MRGDFVSISGESSLIFMYILRGSSKSVMLQEVFVILYLKADVARDSVVCCKRFLDKSFMRMDVGMFVGREFQINFLEERLSGGLLEENYVLYEIRSIGIFLLQIPK